MPTDNLEIILDDMDRFIGRQITALAFEVQATLIEFTPLDLGWARANYVPKINTPHRENLTSAEPSSETAAAQAAKTSSELFTIAASYTAEQGPFYISNNVPYIGRLNDGHSKQAPAGFIQLAVNTAVAKRRRGL